MKLLKKPEKNPISGQTIKEEIANAMTHGIGIPLSLIALIVLIISSLYYKDLLKTIALSIYGFSLLLLYSCSTLYHYFSNMKIKHYFHILDHASIYLLIAGTYTPFLLINLRGPLGWGVFLTIWILAILGIVFKLNAKLKYEKISVAIYIVMGWLIIVFFNKMLEEVHMNGIFLLIGGGLFYTLGIIFFLWNKLPFQHMIWHFFVLGGSVCHFGAIWFYVLPKIPH